MSMTQHIKQGTSLRPCAKHFSRCAGVVLSTEIYCVLLGNVGLQENGSRWKCSAFFPIDCKWPRIVSSTRPF